MCLGAVALSASKATIALISVDRPCSRVPHRCVHIYFSNLLFEFRVLLGSSQQWLRMCCAMLLCERATAQ